MKQTPISAFSAVVRKNPRDLIQGVYRRIIEC
jgi:hypothetical protein